MLWLGAVLSQSEGRLFCLLCCAQQPECLNANSFLKTAGELCSCLFRPQHDPLPWLEVQEQPRSLVCNTENGDLTSLFQFGASK